METERQESTVPPEPEPDQNLVKRAQGGDAQAMSVLYARYRRKVMNYLYRYTGNRSSAEELTQDTFLRVVQNVHRYRPTGSVAGWIYRIAGNVGLNSLRDKPKVHEISLDEPMELEGNSVNRSEVIPGPSLRPDEEAIQTERDSAVQRALLQIPPLYREVMILCDIEGYPYREVADMLHCPINTVASRLARGRAQLAQLLGYLRRNEP